MEDARGLIPWLIAALGVLWAIVKTFGNREVQRYDESVARIAKMERENVTREELNEILDRRDQERRRWHEENVRVLERIEDKLDDVGDLAARVGMLERDNARKN